MTGIIKAFLGLCLFGATIQEQRYDGYHLVNVMPWSEDDLAFLKHMESDDTGKLMFWSEPIAVGRNVTLVMDAATYSEVVQQLSGAGLHPSLVTDNIQRLLNEERKQTFAGQSRMGGGGAAINLNQYNSHAQMNSWLRYLHRTCKHCHVFSIGRSYEGRDMRVIKIHTGHAEKPAIWIDAGIHAREWIAPATALYIINELRNPYNPNGQARQLLKDFDFYILPSANPDGYEYSRNEQRFWRKTRQPNANSTCIGVDPNRNWDFHWMETGASANPCEGDYAGLEPFSEPETKAVSDYLMANKEKFVAYLTFHSYGQWWLTPWGYTSALPDDYDDLVRVANKATSTIQNISGNKYTVGSSTNVLYAAAGGSDDWAKGVAGIPFSYTIELQDEGWHGFVLPADQIEPQGKEMWAALRATAGEMKKVLAERS